MINIIKCHFTWDVSGMKFISITDFGHPNENALAYRFFRTLKKDFQHSSFTSIQRVTVAMTQAVQANNGLRFPFTELPDSIPAFMKRVSMHRNELLLNLFLVIYQIC